MKIMENEAWLNGAMSGFNPVMMPAAHALAQAIKDLNKAALNLSDEELLMRPNNAPSAAFHLRHIAGSIDRLLTYARNEQLSDKQFAELTAETAPDSTDNAARLTLLRSNLRLKQSRDSTDNAARLTQKAVDKINLALDALKNVSLENLFEERFVGRKKLLTNVFGLLFHIAEHTARHTGQIVTTTKIVRSYQ